uniref:Bifunctional purine biosynthesis protein ATIC n=1 Tax=Elaeophora elaphi TaxID=1147741 RepID=A0A0R3RWG1_9BILA
MSSGRNRYIRALISVSDKAGLTALAHALHRHGIEILSTGGTSKTIAAEGIPVIDVSEITNFPEIMDGRVKTLHPKVHGGLLAVRDDPEHADAMQAHGIGAIDLAVINLYPFEEVRHSGADYANIVENIDIGGPAMIRAAAKNHAYVGVVTDTGDYEMVIAMLDKHEGSLPYSFRQSLAAKAYARTATYDAAISGWFTPSRRAIGGHLHSLQGKQLSYNNINDTDAAFELVAEFDPARTSAVAIIKHANPCGVAEGATLKEAYLKALACDPVSAFGGIVALNKTLDADAAEEIVKTFTEVIIAPDATPEAQAIVAAKKNLRLLVTGGLPDPRASGITAKTVAGGILVQSRDSGVVDDLDLKVVTKRAPTEQEMTDLKLAFRIAKHVKSNAIVYVKDGAAVGIGAGQMSRVDSARIAARKAEDAAEAAGLATPLTKGSVVASDAFFPFADGLLSAVAAGATAVIQPGGSMRDEDVITAADEHGIAMVFTGMRHFRH